MADTRENLDVHSTLMGLLQRAPYIGCADTDRQYAVNWLMNNGVTIQKWIPVTERLPEESGLCLVYTARGMVMEMDYSAKYKQFNMYDDGIGTPIACTHWMYMPEPPKGE